MIGSASAQKRPVPKPVDRHVLAEEDVKDLLLLKDTDKNGRISKQEWMKSMESQFDRLDKDHWGELDVKEIAESRLRATRYHNFGSSSG